jgi:hypothetical protein
MSTLLLNEDDFTRAFVATAQDDYFTEDGLSDRGKIAMYRFLDEAQGIPESERASDEEVLALINRFSGRKHEEG